MAYLPVPFLPAFATNGILAPGAVLKFYITGTTNPTPVYADADLNTSLGPTVTADAFGRFVDIFLDDEVIYYVRLETAGGALIDEVDPVSSGLIAALGQSDGASRIGFIQPGAGAQAETLQDAERRSPAAVEQFSGTTSAALLAAVTAHREVRLVYGATYSLATLVNISAFQKRKIYLNGATIQAAGGFSDTHLISMSGDSEIIGPGTIDGTNVPAPAGAYASGVYAGVGIYITGTGNDGVIDGVTFQNFQSGPILHDSATTRSGFKVRNCTLNTVQIYTANATNAAVAMHGVSRGAMVDNRLNGYNWKGFYFANGDFNKIVRCHSTGGVDGHASHYITGGADNSITDCTHEGIAGVGFGFKCSDTTRPAVLGFKAKNCRSGGMFQGCEDFTCYDMTVDDSTIAPLFIEGSSTYGAATRGIVDGIIGRHTDPGVSAADRGIYISGAAKLSRTVTAATNANPCVITTSVAHGFKAGERASFSGVGGTTQLNGNTYFVRNPTPTTFELGTATGTLDSTAFGVFTSGGSAACGGEIDRLTISNFYFDNMLFGIHVNNSGFQQTNISILNGRTVNTGQYGVIAFAGSIKIAGCNFQMDGAAVAAGILVAGDGVTTTGTLVIEDNDISLATGDNIQIGEGSRFSYEQITVVNNRTVGGARFLDYQGNANSADLNPKVKICDNQGADLTTGGCALAFNTTTSTVLQYERNDFRDTSNVPVADTIGNLTNLSVTGTFSQTGSPESVYAARIGTLYTRLDGGASTTLYVKTSGTGNTGWTAK